MSELHEIRTWLADRLRRLAEVGGIDLGDPEARFVAMLQLRVLVPGRPEGPATG